MDLLHFNPNEFRFDWEAACGREFEWDPPRRVRIYRAPQQTSLIPPQTSGVPVRNELASAQAAGNETG